MLSGSVRKLIERLDEERAAAASRVENAEALQFLLPLFKEADKGLALRLVERVQIVGVGIGQRLAGGSGGFRLLLLAQRFEALFQHADGAEQAPEVLPEGVWIVRVAIDSTLIRILVAVYPG